MATISREEASRMNFDDVADSGVLEPVTPGEVLQGGIHGAARPIRASAGP